MKTYSVKQVADLLGTKPETVRRWIREKKLCATQKSKKEGNVITEKDLFKFVESAPKYASILTMAIGAAPTISIPVIAAGGAAAAAIKSSRYKRERMEIDSIELLTYLVNSIEASKEFIRLKQQEIELAMAEIDSKNTEIEELTSILEELKKDL